MSDRILMAVDDSPASRRALDYVAESTAGRPDTYVHLVHVLPAKGGGEEGRASSHELLEGMRGRLISSGLSGEHVDTGTLSAPAESALIDGLIDLGTDQSCSTIVVGRNSLPWYRELFHAHPADQLVRKAQGFTVWVVE